MILKMMILQLYVDDDDIPVVDDDDVIVDVSSVCNIG